MGRRPKMSKRRGRNYYSTKKDGVEFNLGTDERQALKEFYKIWGSDEKPSPRMLAVDLFARYLEWSETHHAPAYHKRIEASLASFEEKVIKTPLRVEELTPLHLTTWLEKRCPRRPKDDSKPVSDNTRHDYASDILGVFNWAAKQRIIPASPFFGFTKPAKSPRAACLSAEQWDELLTHVRDDAFRDFIQIMRKTGCRPQEARIMEARHVRFKEGLIFFKDGEVPGKTGDREIPLTEAAASILKPLVLKYPEGPLLRNTRGRPWGKNSLNSRFQRLKTKLPFRAHCYVARHSVATDMLEAGASTGAVAATLGHKDPTMVLKTYGKHIEKRRGHLRECLEKATEKRESA